jgi:hypothetical protein
MFHTFRHLFGSLVLTVGVAATVQAQDTAANHAQTVHALEGVVWAVMMPLAFITAIGGLIYLGRALIEHRRWLYATKLQADAQTKIIDRLSASEDLIAYLQSPAAQRLIATSAPLNPRQSVAAPATRVLWSVQTGIVLALAGIGLWIGAGRAFEEVAEALRIVAILAIAVGAGFVLSAAVSLVLSRRLGLLDPSPESAA